MHIIDRRLNPRGKSLENRQRFLRRAKDAVEQAVKRSLQNRSIRDVLDGGEVTLPIGGMSEPGLHRGGGGIQDRILPGNQKFVEGDFIKRPPASGGGRSSEAGEGDGEDGFRFVLTREEFLNIFLEDLELPDLAKRRLSETDEVTPQRAGFSVSGSPSNIAVGRTTRLAMMRRLALHRPKPEEIEALQKQIDECDDAEERLVLEERLRTLTLKSKRIPSIDPLDVRYRRFENTPKPVVKAVMFCLMDVSGSMSEHMKDLAKRFYLLLYLFLSQRYEKVEIVFIRHTEKAEVADEETFFYSTQSGGTVVSTALEEMIRVIEERYPSQIWNIYAAQASDGDNIIGDSEHCAALLREKLTKLCQYYAYVEIIDERETEIFGSTDNGTALWRAYRTVDGEKSNFQMTRIAKPADIYPVFRRLFARQLATRTRK